jgi:hypothetical protein
MSDGFPVFCDIMMETVSSVIDLEDEMRRRMCFPMKLDDGSIAGGGKV